MSYQLPPDIEQLVISNFKELKQEVGRGIEQLDRGDSHDSEEMFGELLRDLPTVD